MGKNNKTKKSDHKIARQPDINNIGKLINSDKLTIELKNRMDHINVKNLTESQLKEIVKIINTDSKKDQTFQPDNLASKPNNNPDLESGELDETMGDISSSILNSFIKNPIANKDISKKIPAIKFKIAADISDKFKNQLELTKEINRCHQHLNKKAIKFVSIRDNLIIIATDDQATFDLLNSNWPKDAFIKGIRMLNKKTGNNNTTKTIIIKGVHSNIDINDKEIADQLKEQGLVNITRIVSKSQQVTTLLKAEAIDQDAYNTCLKNKIKIGYIKCHTEPMRTVLQCFKCQKVGHTHFNCKNETTCPKCSGKHSLKECVAENQIKCINCGGDHFACARKCPFLKEAIKININKKSTSINLLKSTKTYAQVAQEKPKVIQATQPTSSQTLDSISPKIDELITKKLNQMIENILPALIESILSKLLSNPRLACYSGVSTAENLYISPYKKKGDDSIPATPRYKGSQQNNQIFNSENKQFNPIENNTKAHNQNKRSDRPNNE